jgi:hypothetical protein
MRRAIIQWPESITRPNFVQTSQCISCMLSCPRDGEVSTPDPAKLAKAFQRATPLRSFAGAPRGESGNERHADDMRLVSLSNWIVNGVL